MTLAAGATSGTQEAEQLAVDTDLGARRPGGLAGRLLFGLALAWSLFQLYIASPLPFMLPGLLLLDDTESRTIHLAFAFVLAFAAFPAHAHAPRDRVPALDWAIALIAAASCLYINFFYAELSRRSGSAVMQDVVVASIGLVCLLEATRRAIGVPLVIVACLFIVYTFAGPHMPDLIAHRGTSLGRFADHMWLSTEGVFGIAIGVSTSTVFLYVLFGTLLDQAGAGNYFMKLCFALLGHLRGGPAKAAVVSSALNGLFSGSAIANIVTGGLFTIPLMKRVGFSPEKAAAVEVSSSLNGQIMPPVMGAAAFLIAESVGVPYVEVVTSAFIPAVISYIALFYIVHLEAVKERMPIIPRRRIATPAERMLGWTTTVIVSFTATAILYYGLAALRGLLPGGATLVTFLLFVVTYLALLWNACRYPALEMDDPSARIYELPETWPTLMAGLHHLLPVVVLIWGLMVDEMSAGLAAYWAILALVAITLTQRPLAVLIRGEGDMAAEMRLGFHDLLLGLVAGGRNMAGVAMAMASAGIVVGVVSLTGIGLLMTEIINEIAGGHLMAALVLTALITLILGMGLPTTANYVVVAAVMAPVLPVLAAQNGLIVPAMAVHLFIFYFGLLSGVTPPVAVDAYAGAALARSNPIQTCMFAFYYSIRTAILPFVFIFNTDLLLIGVDSIWHFALILTVSIIAMLLFVAVTHHWFLVRSRVWESALLLLICFTLFRPAFWLDQVMPPYRSVPPKAIFEQAATAPPNALMRVWVSGLNFSGDPVRKLVALHLGATTGGGAERIEKAAGLKLQLRGEKVVVAALTPNGQGQRAGMDLDWEIEQIELPEARPDKEWLFIPALALLGVVVLVQNRRRLREPALD